MQMFSPRCITSQGKGEDDGRKEQRTSKWGIDEKKIAFDAFDGRKVRVLFLLACLNVQA